MGKMATYIIMLTGIMLLFHIAGLIENTGNSELLNLALDPSSIADTPTYVVLLETFAVVIAAGVIIIGLIFNISELAIIAPMALYFLNMGWDFLAVFNKVKATSPIIALLIFSPLLILWLVVIIDWWRGRD